MRAHMWNRDWEAAQSEADLAIAEDPESRVPWQWKALAHARAEEYPAAMEAIEAALEIAPGNDYSLETKAKLLRRMDRLSEVEPLVEDAIANHKVGPWAWSYAGYFRLRAKEYRPSALAFSEALHADPHNAYDRRKFLEACRLAGPDCPPLFPEKRASYAELSCEDIALQFAEQYPGFHSGAGFDTPYDLIDQGDWRAKVLVQVVYLGTAIGFEQTASKEYANRLIALLRRNPE
ncbi:tetratricopeptide repeat protein [Phaeobacter piscinae]|uniref:tetratricopeptide repeat protein n=1 Tax=Phaeobacter piscinae TaxID=1580596 RepID=UPI00103D4CA4|nr:hypothetical protein [Phaeobacter piscinae]